VTVRDWLSSAAEKLEQAGIESARMEAQILLAHELGVDRAWLVAHGEDELSAIESDRLARRIAGEPLAYIIGRREFFGRDFVVRPGVLIPRQETETLVEHAMEQLSAAEPAVLDLCTGSGCIGITIKLERPSARVTISDISTEALEIAKENARNLGADVACCRSDLFNNLIGTFDCITANPPYVAQSDPLPREIADHEPHIALYADQNGLAIYRRIAQEAKPFLNPNGVVIVESGDRMHAKVKEIFRENGWQHAGDRADLSGCLRSIAHKLP